MGKNIDVVIHTAWKDGFVHNSISHIEDLSAHFKFLIRLHDMGVRHFAVLGSFREYGLTDGMVSDEKIVPCNLYSLAKITLYRSLEFVFGEDVCFQWLRPFSVYGDDINNHSLFSKILEWEREGRKKFPFTDGSEEYDFIHINEVARQIVATISQSEIQGAIDICSGKPKQLKMMVNDFIRENHLSIRPDYGVFKRRSYDSDIIYGNNKKILEIMRNTKLYNEISSEVLY